MGDTGAPLGTVTIGEVSFDEMKLRQLCQHGPKAKEESGLVSVNQVVKMLAVQGDPREGERLSEREQIAGLERVGFKPHVLSDGGAAWLAFCEIDVAQVADSGLLCCA